MSSDTWFAPGGSWRWRPPTEPPADDASVPAADLESEFHDAGGTTLPRGAARSRSLDRPGAIRVGRSSPGLAVWNPGEAFFRFKGEAGKKMAVTPLRGRESERGTLCALIGAARDLVGGIVVVEGAAGIGKTRLLEEAWRMAAGEGLVVATSRADELDQVTPWGVLLRALSASDPPLVDPAGIAELRDLSDQRLAVIDHVRAELEDASSREPILVAIDDLQWADGATLLAVGLLPAQLFSYPIAWLFGLRRFPASSRIDRVLQRLDEAGASHLHLGPLELSAATELARDVAGSPPPEDLPDVVARAEGNPLYTIELLRAGVPESGHARAVASGVPRVVRTAIMRHLGSLSDSAQQLLSVASVLGREFSVAEVAAMTASPASALVPAVHETLHAEILLELPDRLAFRHDLLRQAVYETLPGSVRIALHRDAAEVLRQAGASPARIAAQLAIGAQPGDASAIDVMHRAVGELSPASPRAAADLAGRVLELVGEDDDRRLEVVRTATSALTLAGRVDEAVALAERHLETHRVPVRLEAGWQLELRSAWAFARYQPYPTPVADRVLRDPSVDPAVQATLAALERAPIWLGPADEPDRTLERALRIAREGARPFEFTLLARLQAIRLALCGRLEEALAGAQAAREVALGLGESSVVAVHHSSVAAQLAANGRIGEALELMRTASAAAGPAERAASEPTDEWTLKAILLNQGRLEDAHANAVSELELVGELGHFGRVSQPLATLIETSLRLGRTGAAAAALTQHGPSAQGMQSDKHYAAALIGDARGDQQAVQEALAPILAELELGRFDVVVGQPHRLPLLVQIARRAGAEDAAHSIARRAEELAGRNRHVDLLGAAAADARGIVEQNEELLREAVEQAARSESRLLEAGAREDLGTALVDTGRGREATQQLEAAYDFYQHAGAERDLARVRGVLRRLGVRKPQTSVARPAHGWESLTKSERVVVDLVAKGLTNREAAAELFLSPETINTHLRHAFAKLGIRSRVQLARMAVQREQVPS
jgi:DNA-binding CsgD family transcriptional regulator